MERRVADLSSLRAKNASHAARAEFAAVAFALAFVLGGKRSVKMELPSSQDSEGWGKIDVITVGYSSGTVGGLNSDMMQ